MNENSPLLRPCPICGTQEGRRLHHQRFTLPDGHPLGTGYHVVVCSGCGFGFADTQATQADYDRYYAAFSKYADAATSTGGGASWEAERLRDTARCIAAFDPDRNVRILDMGCATGGLLRALRAEGFVRLAGVDPSPGCVRALAGEDGIEAREGTLFGLPNMGRFGGVVLSHVLEHVRDLVPAMLRLRDLLVPGGWVYLETPDATHYRDFLVAPFQDFNTEHINHFSDAGLCRLLQASGFSVEDGGQKTILSAPRMPYPAVWRFGRKMEGAPQPVRGMDTGLADALGSYIRDSHVLMELLDRKIARILERHPRLVVWGTGQLTLKLLAETCLGRAEIVAFVDGNPVHQGRRLNGVPIVGPEALRDRTEAVLVASLINQDAILKNLQKLDVSNPVFTLDGGMKA